MEVYNIWSLGPSHKDYAQRLWADNYQIQIEKHDAHQELIINY